MLLWIVCILLAVVIMLACDAWDRGSLRRWVDTRDARRPEARAWCEAQHRRAMDRWQADQRAETFWQRHPQAARCLPWLFALLTFLALVMLAAWQS